eukprot:4551637-Prymnesium_polylepis.1
MALGSVCRVAAVVPGPSSAEARAGVILRIYAALVLQKSRFSLLGTVLGGGASFVELAAQGPPHCRGTKQANPKP